MNTEESRKQFEAAVLTGDLLPVNSVRRNYMDCRACDYESILTNVAWLAWQAAKAQPQWISVSERLPPVDDQCLFYRPLANKSGDKIIAVKTAIPDGQFCWDNTVPDGETPCNPSNGACHVTHWMPLPAPPEQNK